MTAGMFRSFERDHRFQQQDGDTVMHDELRFSVPLGILGRTLERFVIRNYLTLFLLERNQFVKEVAESEMWREYLTETAGIG